MNCTLDTTINPPIVYITVTGAPENTTRLEVTREYEDGSPSDRVRAVTHSLVGGAGLVTDYDAPTGRLIRYRLKTYTSNNILLDEATVKTSSLPDAKPACLWIADPLDPISSAMEIRGLQGTDKTRTYSGKTRLYTPPKGLPFGVRTEQITPDSIPLVLYTDTDADYQQLQKLVTEAISITLRFPAWVGLPPVIHGMISKIKITPTHSRWVRETVFDLDVDIVQPTRLDIQAFPWAWDDLKNLDITWDDLKNLDITWLQLLRGL